MPRIPVNVDNLKTEVEPLDENIPYHIVVRKVELSDKEDKNGCYYLTGGQVEVLEPVEWQGRSIFFNYIAIPQEISQGASIGERRKAEEQGVALARFIKCLKVPYNTEGLDPDDAIGCEGDVMIKNEEYQGRTNPRVQDWLI